MQMECPITDKNIDTICRVCLTSSVNLTYLKEKTEEKTTDSRKKLSIQNMLEIVTFSKIVFNEKKFPSNICRMCLSFLKIAFQFQLQFNNSQKLLEEIVNEASTKKLESLKEIFNEEDSSPAAVELIYGQNKFDLNSVIVVEEKDENRSSFEGFLNNLGSEISVRFVGRRLSQKRKEKTKRKKLLTEDIHKSEEDVSTNMNKTENVIESKQETKNSDKKQNTINSNKKQNTTNSNKKQKYIDLNISQLRVKKYPKECKIIIEEMTENNESNKIVKTLYECPQCKKVVACERDLETHIEAQHAVQNYLMCDKCGQLLQTQSQLYHHMQKHSGKTFKCDHCDKEYNTISRLKVHLELHKNERPYLCNVCGKNFNYAISLSYHMRLHSDKKMVCNICGLKYRMANTLKRHLRTHTKDKPFQCDYCYKKFASRGEKSCHEMLHTGVRPYHCEFCGKGFIKSINLKMHYLSHPGPHQCDFCQKTFIEMNILKFHMKRVHKY